MMAQLLTAALTLGQLATPHYDLVPKDHDANLDFREEMLEMCGTDRAASAQVKTMCGEDPLFYLNTFAWTYSPKDSVSGSPVTPFITYEFQDECIMEMLDCINRGRDCATPKSRDMGASWMCLSAFEWCWHFRDMLSFLMVSRKEDLVDKKGFPGALFWKLDFLHKNQPRWLLPNGRWLDDKDPNRKKLSLVNDDNGSVIDGESTTGNVGVGDRRTALLVDEHGAMPVDDGYSVVRGTRDTTNCRIFNSTPRGQNAFYEVVTNSSAKVVQMHWSRHPLKCQGLYTSDEEGRLELLDPFRGLVEVFTKGEKDPEIVMFPDDYPFVLDGKTRSPWYDVQCNRCVSLAEIAQELDIDFLGSDYQFFDAAAIEALRKKHCRPPLMVGDIEFDPLTLEPKRFREHPDGRLKLWIQLDEHGRVPRDMKFVIGSDVSAGTNASNSVSSVVDRVTGQKVGVFHDSNLRPNPFAAHSVALGKFFNRAFMVWDATGPTGETFTRFVVKSGYGNIYYQRNEKKVSREVSDKPGAQLMGSYRTSLFEDYRQALADHKFINRSETGMKECLQFIRKPDGTIEHSDSLNAQDPSGARSAHGDECVADVLACLGLSEREQSAEFEDPDIPMNTLAYRMQQKQRELAFAGSDTLGDEWG